MGLMFKVTSAVHIGLFRLTGGRVGGAIQGQKIMLLTTTGNKSGKERTVPIMCFEDDGRRFVIASAAGATVHPAWFKNLEKNPSVKAELRGEKQYAGRAEVLAGDERDRLFDKVVKVAPGFGAYQKKSGGRVIPVVEIKPA
jgi:deazaflavin-dependent oxidoreductase (nitroreductase family)